MIIQVREHPGRPRPGGVSFDGNQLVAGVLRGVTAAAGAHPPHSELNPGGRFSVVGLWSVSTRRPRRLPSPPHMIPLSPPDC